ncbi:hypothetical protein [Beijerinckia sp. L45]|uniref:hypothetical protein n=1 Tax=Beijerinckia sp. L45 TaxID=1641855 RepID=UPI00131BED20|nr:hypothetical protein [Beijerinckia sp. L45]
MNVWIEDARQDKLASRIDCLLRRTEIVPDGANASIRDSDIRLNDARARDDERPSSDEEIELLLRAHV